MQKILIIRFSSFGDIVQCSHAAARLKEQYPQSEISWLVRKDLAGLVEGFAPVDRIIAFDRQEGILGLIKLGIRLRLENFDLIYDAHQNQRSLVVRFILRFLVQSELAIRRKERWKRFLLFFLRVDCYPLPYRGALSFVRPLVSWVGKSEVGRVAWKFNHDFEVKWPKEKYHEKIFLVPSAAWQMKRWPKEYWIELIHLLPEESFVLLGGPEDEFLEEIQNAAPQRVENLAGKSNLRESCFLLSQGKYFISADTGLLHVGDSMGLNGIALIGPTAFGHPSGSTIKVLEVDMKCRPCTKDGSGNCQRETWQECMVQIKPQQVAGLVRQELSLAELSSTPKADD